MALSADETLLYIADSGANAILTYNIETTELSSFLTDGVQNPVALLFYQGSDPTLYILNYNGGAPNILAYDLTTHTGTPTSVSLATGLSEDIPAGFVVNPEGPFLYLVNGGTTHNILSYDITNGTTEILIPSTALTEGLPGGLAFKVDPMAGPTLYISAGGSNPSFICTYIVDSMTLGPLVEVSNTNLPYCLALTPDGNTLYFGNNATGGSPGVYSWLISSDPGAASPLLEGLKLGSNGLALSPDGTTLYIANSPSYSSNILTCTIETGETQELISGLSEPRGLAISPDGQTLYVADISDSTIYSCNINTPDFISLGTAGAEAFGLAISPDGNTLYIGSGPNRSDGVVYTCDINTQTIDSLITSGISSSVNGVALNSDGSTLYMTAGNVVYSFDLTHPSSAVQTLFTEGLSGPYRPHNQPK